VNSVLILDPHEAQRALDARRLKDVDHFDEMWNGRVVLPPMPNNEHFLLTIKLCAIFAEIVDWDRGDRAFTGGNVSDRDEGWRQNYRNPDILVALAGGVAVDRNTHWLGGPDLLVEIISPGEDPYAKFDFYAEIGTREVLVVDRDPWSLDLFTLVGGKLISAGQSNLANPQWFASQSLPLTFRLLSGKAQPIIEVAHAQDGRRWTIKTDLVP